MAVSRLKATSFFRGPVLVQGRASADQLAYDTGRNTLNITSRLMPTYRDFELLNKPSTKRRE